MKEKNIRKAFLITSITIIVLFLIYTKYYYGSLNIETLTTHFIFCFNILIKNLLEIVQMFLKALLTESNMKVIVIIISIIYLLSNIKFLNFIMGIDTVTIGDIFKFERNREKLKELNKIEKQAYGVLKKDKSIHNETEVNKAMENTEIKMTILEILVDEPYVLNILINFIEKKLLFRKIPISKVKENTSIQSIGTIFNYEIMGNYLKIVSIKDDVKDLILDIYLNVINES